MPPFPTIPVLHAAYAAGQDPRTVVAEAYRRLAAVDDPGIFLALVPEEVAQAAAAALPPFDPGVMPLWGVPFAVKDNIDVAGLPTTAACPDYAYTPTETAPAVARLQAAGAIGTASGCSWWTPRRPGSPAAATRPRTACVQPRSRSRTSGSVSTRSSARSVT